MANTSLLYRKVRVSDSHPICWWKFPLEIGSPPQSWKLKKYSPRQNWIVSLPKSRWQQEHLLLKHKKNCQRRLLGVTYQGVMNIP